MTRFLVRRVLLLAPMALGVATLVFLVVHLAPGDPARLLASPGMRAEDVERLRVTYGLDRPLPVQYARWIAGAARGDLGISFDKRVPVSRVIASALPNTLLLGAAALVVAFALGIGIGLVQAVRHRTALDGILSTVTLVFYSMPAFWLALLLGMVFSYLAFEWGWPIRFPASGARGMDHDLLGPWDRIVDRARHLVLPAMSLALVLMAGISRYVRAGVLEVIRQDYIRAARARGIPERTVIVRHALRNALLPVISLLGLYLPLLFTGAVLVESVFGYPGMGGVLVDAIAARDYPVIMGSTLLFAILVLVGNLVADVLYAVADPRVRYE